MVAALDVPSTVNPKIGDILKFDCVEGSLFQEAIPQGRRGTTAIDLQVFIKRANLPEVPRLRSKFRGKRLILGGQYCDGKMTTKRWHKWVAESLGLTEKDWDSGAVYTVDEDDLDDIARNKEEGLRVSATSTIQVWWRHIVLRSYLKSLNQ